MEKKWAEKKPKKKEKNTLSVFFFLHEIPGDGSPLPPHPLNHNASNEIQGQR